ncbi:MAG TPA: hypothetical protein VE992_05940 [Solirubrobacteraceae bacterium]|nr:hypothetical protein [Solirubrobacteraceae bacterium]
MGWSFLPSAARGRGVRLAVSLAAVLLAGAFAVPGPALAAHHARHHVRAHRHHFRIRRFGELDCNGYSRRQHSLKGTMPCTDIRGLRGVSNDWSWHGRFFDNNHYIGHDEPDMTFLSSAPGSGNDVTWSEQLPYDPAATPTVSSPGSDVTHWFELSIAPWFSMAQCDPSSYPQLPCTPRSDENAPSTSPHGYPGAGGAFQELQFYPPGFPPPWTDGISCDDTHWCAAMTIDSLECTLGFAHCNPNCVEPVNFAFIADNGVPAGPPSPQKADLDTFMPNSHTLLMNPGDRLVIHMWDAPVPGEPGQMAFKVTVKDLTTGQEGFMQASARNGFQNTSIVDCSGTPFNFQPEYNTARKQNITPWAALQTDISTQYEIGHFEPCTSLSDPAVFTQPGGTPDMFWQRCHGPYEDTTSADGANNPELTDGPCYPAGYTHGTLNTPPDTVTGCALFFTQNGDLDFDGTPYWADWPTTAILPTRFPGSFVQQLPTSRQRSYREFFIQTDAALSESTCTASSIDGCAIPPPNAPGKFYPYFTRGRIGAACAVEFGNVSSGNTYGRDAQYGANMAPVLGYPEFEGPVMPNSSC